MKRTLICLLVIGFIGCKNQNNYSNKIEFQWDFSNQIKLIYSYEHSATNDIQMWKDEDITKRHTQGEGHLNVRVKDNNFSDVSITDLEMKIINIDENGKVVDTVSNNIPNTVIQNMNSKGQFEYQNHNIIFDLVFKLPTKVLAIGDHEKVELKIPLNINGSRLSVKGYNNIQYLTNEIFEDKDCAVLKGDINISKLEIPEELTGEYTSETLGKATYYFDLKKNHLVAADIKLSMKFLVDSRSKKTEDLDFFSNMISEDAIKIRLIDINR